MLQNKRGGKCVEFNPFKEVDVEQCVQTMKLGITWELHQDSKEWTQHKQGNRFPNMFFNYSTKIGYIIASKMQLKQMNMDVKS